MSKFENVAIDKNANVYFEGNVSSRTITLSDGSTKTLGIMLPGEYEFNTEKAELMEISSGKLDVTLPNTSDPIVIESRQSFNVPANSSFKVKVHEITDYICSFLES